MYADGFSGEVSRINTQYVTHNWQHKNECDKLGISLVLLSAQKPTLCAHFQHYLYITVNITNRNNSTIFCQQKVSDLMWYAFQKQHSSFLNSGMKKKKKKEHLQYHYEFKRQTLSVMMSNSFLL
jgi:hypothetical protein